MVFMRPCNVWYVTRAVLSVRSDGGTSVGYNTPAANQANASNADAESLTRGDFLGPSVEFIYTRESGKVSY